MNEIFNSQLELQVTCQKQSETIIKQEIQILDLEAEIAFLNKQLSDYQSSAIKYQEDIERLGQWCDHQQIQINSFELTRLQLEKELDFYKTQTTNYQNLSQELQSQLQQQENRLLYRILRKTKSIFSPKNRA